MLGVKGGVDPAKMTELIQKSAGRSYVADVYGPEIVAGTYDESFSIALAAKDMRLAMEMASTMDADLPFMARVAERSQRWGTLWTSCAASAGRPDDRNR